VRRIADAHAGDPLNFDKVRNAARMLAVLGRHAQAEQLLSWHIELHPVDGPAWDELAHIILMAGHPPGDQHPWRNAFDFCQRPEFSIHQDLLSGELDFAMDDEAAGRLAPMERAMFELMKIHSQLAHSPHAFNAAMSQISQASDQAQVFGLAGDKVQVIACLKQAIAAGQLPLEVTHSPFMRKVINDPAVLQVLESVGEAPHQLVRIAFDVSPPAQLAAHRQLQAARTKALALRAQQAQDAFNANPHDFTAVQGAARNLRHLGRINTAEALLRWHIDLHPEGGHGHVELARLLLRTGRLKEARELATEACAHGYDGEFFKQLAPVMGEFAYLGGASDDPDVCLARARNQHDQEHWTSPVTGEARYEPRPRSFARAFENLGDADRALMCAVRGDTESSIAFLQRAAQNGPWPLDVTYAPELHPTTGVDSTGTDWRWLPIMTSIGEAPAQLAAIALRLRIPPPPLPDEPGDAAFPVRVG